MSKIVVLNSEALAQLNPVHSGFAHGFGIFETIKLSAGQLEFWPMHYERFVHSAETFKLHFDQSEAVVLAAIKKLIQAEALQDGIVKLSLLKEGRDSCCYVYTRPIQLPEAPVNVCLDTQSRLNEYSLLAGHKTHNYMEAMYLKQMAQSKGFFDTIRLNTGGFLTETAMANLFFVKDATVFTPALSTGILPGVIRSEVLQAAKKHSIKAEEGHYPLDSLESAEAVFLTNSTVGILSVDSIEAEDFSAKFNRSSKTVERLKIAFEDIKKRKSIALTDETGPKESE